MKNKHLFYIVFQVLKVLVIKICKIQPPDLNFFLFLLAFTLAGIIFVKLLELHSTISEKSIFVTNFPFFNRFTQTPPPPTLRSLNGQNLLSIWQKFFVDAPLPPGKIYLEIETAEKNHNQGIPWVFYIYTPVQIKNGIAHSVDESLSC